MAGSRNAIIWNKVGRLGLIAQSTLVSAVVVAVWALVAPVAYSISGVWGLIAAGAGAGVCWLGAQLAVAIASLFRGPEAVLQRVLLGMLARTMIPLVLGVALHFKFPSLADAGVVAYLLLFYFVTMATDTMLTLTQIPSSSRAT